MRTGVNVATRRVLLQVVQPYANHNGGMLAFGTTDGDLYIGLGDGGSGGDPGNRAQNQTVLLGKILRIDVNGTTGSLPYRIPTRTRSSGATAPTRSGRRACAIRGASASTARTATFGSATSARATGRRSTTP